jgi:hypothetical protein
MSVGGSLAVVELEGQIWVFGPDLGSTGHDLDARQSSMVPGRPGCAWLAYHCRNMEEGPVATWGWPE